MKSIKLVPNVVVYPVFISENYYYLDRMEEMLMDN